MDDIVTQEYIFNGKNKLIRDEMFLAYLTGSPHYIFNLKGTFRIVDIDIQAIWCQDHTAELEFCAKVVEIP